MITYVNAHLDTRAISTTGVMPKGNGAHPGLHTVGDMASVHHEKRDADELGNERSHCRRVR